MIPHHALLGAGDAPKLAFLLHGVLGAGHNLRSLANQLIAARPEFRIALLDLRYHGKSLGAPSPHNLGACADDLFDLVEHLGQAPEVVIGHSLGGKVALEYGKRHEDPVPGTRTALPGLEETLAQVWTLDSDPGAQEPDHGHQVGKVLGALQKHPGPFGSRAEAVQSIRNEGFTPGLANWLGTSLERRGDQFTWRFDLDKIPLLLADYFSLDLWPFLEDLKGQNDGGRVLYELLVAENSDRWSGSMKDRANALNDQPRLRVHSLPDSGHWVHVDNPQGLLDILVRHMI
jgi:pimeloyl-ACP methyl ester carboxylesterase